MFTLRFHPFGWNNQEFCIEIDLYPSSAISFRWTHEVNSCLSVRLRVGTGKFDMIGERISFGNSSGLCFAYFLFEFLKCHTDTRCRIGSNQISVKRIDHSY